MWHVVHRAIVLLVLVAASSGGVSAPLDAATDPLATHTGMVRFYFHALGTGQCDLAFKFAGQSSRSLSAFRRSCRAIRRIAIEQLDDPGYRLHPQTAAYTCLAVRYTIYRRSGATTFGGWYLMERALGPAWHILFARSQIAKDGGAIHLTRAQCASHLPPYVHPGSGTIISGFAFLSAAAGWIALSTSGSYLPNGSCSHGIGSNCDSAPTTVYRTDDTGSDWTPILHFTTAVGPPVWIRLFSPQVGLVAATVGPLTPASNQHYTAALFSTHDGGYHWQRFPLPVNYVTQTGSITFPNPQYSWLWYGGGAMGSMSVYVYRTMDGGWTWPVALHTPLSSPFTLWQALDSRHWLFATAQPASQAAIWWTDDAGRSWMKDPRRKGWDHPLQLSCVHPALGSRHLGHYRPTRRRHRTPNPLAGCRAADAGPHTRLPSARPGTALAAFPFGPQ